MSREKMKYVYFVGDKEYLEGFVSKYLIDNYGIQPVNAIGIMENVKGLYAYKGGNPYTDLITRCEKLIGDLGIKETAVNDEKELSYEEIEKFLKDTEEGYAYYRAEKQKINEYIEEKEMLRSRLKDTGEINVEMSTLYNLRFFRIRYGRILSIYYKSLEQYIENLDVIMFHTSSDHEYERLIYIVPIGNVSQVDGIFNSLHFERIRIPDGFTGSPRDILFGLEEDIRKMTLKQVEITNAIADFTAEKARELLLCLKVLQEKNEVYEISRYAAFNKKSFYLVGWIPAKDLTGLQHEIKKDPYVAMVDDPVIAYDKGAFKKLKKVMH